MFLLVELLAEEILLLLFLRIMVEVSYNKERKLEQSKEA